MKITNIYEIVILCMLGMNLGLGLAYHQVPRTIKTNFYVVLLAVVFETWLLYTAGLFH